MSEGSMFMSVLEYRQMTIIKLSGPLIRGFGRGHHWRLDTGSVQEVLSALCSTLPGLKEAIIRLQRLGVRLVIYRNRRNVREDEFSAYGVRGVRIVPVITGSKRAGLVQTIIDITIIAVAMVTTGGIGGFAAGGTWGFVGTTGAPLALGDVVQMLSLRAQGLEQSATSENLSSYAFGSVGSITASGNLVPICYGKRRWGRAIILASIYAEDKT